MSDAKAEAVDWPREIWMAEREEHDQGVVTAVLSEWATVARWEGDKERDREFHHYIDADIHDSAERYHKEMLANERARAEAALSACMVAEAKLAKVEASIRSAVSMARMSAGASNDVEKMRAALSLIADDLTEALDPTDAQEQGNG